jgi:hypothetical protein
MGLAFLLALLLAQAPSENQAERLFRESEKKLADEEQAQIAVESTLEATREKASSRGECTWPGK